MKQIIKNQPRLLGTLRFLYRTLWKSNIIYFLSSSTEPLSDTYGLDRGKPVDRYFIEKFLLDNSEHIKGRCLELLNNDYTIKYGGVKVKKSDVLDIETTNKFATIQGDLRDLTKVEDSTYDCIILTQVLQFIDNLDAALSECYRILKPGGSILVTLPALSRIDCVAGEDGDFWRFSVASTRYIFAKKFDVKKIEIKPWGNVRTGIYFYAGLTQEEINLKIFQTNDKNFPTIITVKAFK